MGSRAAFNLVIGKKCYLGINTDISPLKEKGETNVPFFLLVFIELMLASSFKPYYELSLNNQSKRMFSTHEPFSHFHSSLRFLRTSFP